MADDEEQAAPVEDPIKPGAVTEQEPKAEEPTEETPAPEGGADDVQDGEDEVDSADALKAVIEDMSPEERRALYDEAYESLSDEEKDGIRPEAASEKAAISGAERQREDDLKTLTDSTSARSNTRQAETAAFIKGLSSEEELFDSEGRKAKTPDNSVVGTHIQKATLAAQFEWHDFMVGFNALNVRAGLESHPIHGKLSAEQKQKIDDLGPAPDSGEDGKAWTKAALHIYLDAAVSAAPDSIKAQAKEAAEKEAGLAENKAKLLEALGGRRKKKALAGGGSGGKGWSTKSQARSLHVKKQLTNTDMKRINADPSIPE